MRNRYKIYLIFCQLDDYESNFEDQSKQQGANTPHDVYINLSR